MNKLNIFLLDDNTKINTKSETKKINDIKVQDNVLSVSPNEIKERKIKTILKNKNVNNFKTISLENDLTLNAHMDNHLFVSTEDDYNSYKVAILCCGKYQKIAYAQCPAHLFKSLHPEAERVYIIYICEKEESAKFIAEYFIRTAEITEEQYKEAKENINVDGYADHSFINQCGINENYPSYNKTTLPIYIHLTSHYGLEKQYSVLININNYEKYKNQIEDLLENVLNNVPYKEIADYGFSYEISFSFINYELVYDVVKAVQDFAKENIHPLTEVKEAICLKHGDTSVTYEKLPLSNICPGMMLPVVIDDRVFPTKITGIKDYEADSEDIFDKFLQDGKGLEIEDLHNYVVNHILVPDNKK